MDIRLPGAQWGINPERQQVFCCPAPAEPLGTLFMHNLPMTHLPEEPVQPEQNAAQPGAEAPLLVSARLLAAQGVHHTALQLRCVCLPLPAAASA